MGSTADIDATTAGFETTTAGVDAITAGAVSTSMLMEDSVAFIAISVAMNQMESAEAADVEEVGYVISAFAGLRRKNPVANIIAIIAIIQVIFPPNLRFSLVTIVFITFLLLSFLFISFLIAKENYFCVTCNYYNIINIKSQKMEFDKNKQKFYNGIGDNMEKQILHIDVNNAFLSWTAVDMLKQGDKVDIREIPAIIGGDESKRSGIVLAKSMKAKECGIRTAETIYQAKQKCHNLKVFPSNFKIYRKYSDDLYHLLLQYTDKIERFSIDECFLDMTHYLMKETLWSKAKEISKRVKEELGFTVNIGVANNKLLAKMASDFTKPDKIHTLYQNEIKEKMWSLPISELFMLGKKTVPKLYNLQIKTIGDLAKADKKMLEKKFGKHGVMIWEYANGIDNSEVKYLKEKPKGIGNSITLPQNISDMKRLEEILLALAEQVTYRLRKYDLLANTVSVQLRTKEFEDNSHQGKLIIATASTKEIYQKAKELIEQMYQKEMVIRLIGLRVDNLEEKKKQQLSLFQDEQNKKQEKLDQAIDALKEKYGYNSITRAGKMKVDKMLKLKDIE